MIKQIIGIVGFTLLGIHLCTAQSGDSQTNTNWGDSVQGVQLSISLSNNIIAAGSTVPLSITITNSSTNIIQLHEPVPPGYNEWAFFLVTMTSSLGKEYPLTPIIFMGNLPVEMIVSLKPGETRSWFISITIGKGIDPGDYTLKARRNEFTATSNLLKVQVN